MCRFSLNTFVLMRIDIATQLWIVLDISVATYTNGVYLCAAGNVVVELFALPQGSMKLCLLKVMVFFC